MTCNRCGAAAPSGATFCRECGAIIEVRDPSTPSSGSTLSAAVWPGLRIAAIALVLGAAAATLLTVVWRLAAGAPDDAAGSVLRITANSWLVAHGGIAGVGLTLTGATWLWLATRLAVTVNQRRTGPVQRPAAAAATTAVAYGVVVFVLIEAVLPDRAVDLGSIGVVRLAGTGRVALHAAVVVAVVFVSAFGAMLAGAGRRFGDLLPPGRIADAVNVAGAGALRVALVAVGTSVIIVAVHLMAQVSGDPVSRLGNAGAFMAWFGVDLGFGFIVAAMRFFTLELYPFQVGVESATPAWAWIGLPLVLVAYILGGARAGRLGTRLGVRPFTAGLAAGLGFVVIATVASGVAAPNLDGLSKTALLTSLGWAVVPAVAAAATAATHPPPVPMPPLPVRTNAGE